MTGPRRRQLFECLAAILRRDDPPPLLPWDSPELWKRLVPLADFHQVTTALPGALKALEVWKNVPGDAAELLSALHELNVARNRALEAQGLRVLAILDAAGICAVPLKGLAYSIVGLFPDDTGRRLTTDIDILVEEHAARDARNVLIDAGYHSDPNSTIDEESHHHLVPLFPDGETHGPAAVEVHFRLVASDHIHLLPHADIFAAASAVDVDGRTVRVPTTVDLIDHAIVHGGLVGFQKMRRTVNLREAFDIARLWQRARAEGHGLDDLRSAQRQDLMLHLGACLLLAGASPSELGRFAPAATKHLGQVLRRQSMPESVVWETVLIQNLQLLARNPASFAAKFFQAERYRSLLVLISSRST